MQRLFGKATTTVRGSSAARSVIEAPSTSLATEETSATLDLIEKRSEHIARLIDKEVSAARAAAAAGNQKAALEAIKRKKLHEKEAERLATNKLNLIQQETMLQSLKFNAVVVRTQELGAAAIEREVKKVGSAEGAERVLDRLEDALADAADVLDAGKRKLGDAGQMDDDELLEELEQLEMLDEVCTTSIPDAREQAPMRPEAMPVPKTTPGQVAKRADEEREEREMAELAKLSADMLTVDMPMPMPMMAACH